MDRTAMPPQRTPNTADARAPCSLLAPQLLAASADLSSDFGRGHPGSKRVIVVFHGLPNEGLVEFRLENFIGKLQLADYLIGKVFYLNLRHHQPLPNYELRMTNDEFNS
jgi:hypothetical protein